MYSSIAFELKLLILPYLSAQNTQNNVLYYRFEESPKKVVIRIKALILLPKAPVLKLKVKEVKYSCTPHSKNLHCSLA